jgi:hypothetical protein
MSSTVQDARPGSERERPHQGGEAVFEILPSLAQCGQGDEPVLAGRLTTRCRIASACSAANDLFGERGTQCRRYHVKRALLPGMLGLRCNPMSRDLVNLLPRPADNDAEAGQRCSPAPPQRRLQPYPASSFPVRGHIPVRVRLLRSMHSRATPQIIARRSKREDPDRSSLGHNNNTRDGRDGTGD